MLLSRWNYGSVCMLCTYRGVLQEAHMKSVWQAILAKRVWQVILAASVIVGLAASGVGLYQFIGGLQGPPSFSGTWTGTVGGVFSQDHFVLQLSEQGNALTGVGKDTLKVIVSCPQE